MKEGFADPGWCMTAGEQIAVTALQGKGNQMRNRWTV